MTVFSEEFFKQQIEVSDYTENIMKDLQETLSSYGSASGFEPKFFRSAVSPDLLQADIYREISRIYGTTAYPIDTEGFKASLLQDLYKDVERQGRTEELTDESKEGLEYLANISTAAYYNLASIPFSNQISSLLQKAKGIFRNILFMLIIIDIVSLLFICFFGRSLRRKLECIINALAGSILIIVLPILALKLSNIIPRLNISNQALYYFFQSYVNSLFSTAGIFLLVMAALWGCIFLYRYSYIHNKRRSHSHSY
jgi:hypothetical protein